MQLLIFHLGHDRYGLDTRRVIRVLPLIELKKLPQAPDYVAGLLNFHGNAIPVIDLCLLGYGTPCHAHYNTRIVLVEYAPTDHEKHTLGLVAERVTGVQRVAQEAFVAPGVAAPDAPYLGQVATHDGGILQLIEVEQLLTDELRAILFPKVE